MRRVDTVSLTTDMHRALCLPQPHLIAVLKSVTIAFILAFAAIAGGISFWLSREKELSAVRTQVWCRCSHAH